MANRNNYLLLPFKFTRLDGKELIVNEVGDYIIAENGTVKSILDRTIDCSSALFKDLLAKFIVCNDYHEYLLDVIATRLRTKKAFLDHFTSLHIFVLTLRCNQKCIYCQASSQDRTCSAKDMSIEDIDAAITLMLQSPNPSITMELQGGESSLVPDLVEHAILETEKRNQTIGKDIKYVLCTNIIKFDDRLIDFCELHNVFISTSLDGNPYLHDHNRGVQGSYNCFCNSLMRIREKMGYDRISPLMTTSEESLKYPKEIINAYRELGFNSIFLRPLNPYGKAKFNADWKAYFDKFIEFYKVALDYIIELNQKGEEFSEGFTALIMRKVFTPFPIGFVDLQSPAGIINNVVVYNYDGYVYCSDESRMMAEQNDYTFRLGKMTEPYNNLFYGEKAQSIAEHWATEYIAGCSDCAFQQYCGADPVRNYSTQGDSYGFRPTSLFCYFHKKIFKYIFTLIDTRKEVLPILRKWAYQ